MLPTKPPPRRRTAFATILVGSLFSIGAAILQSKQAMSGEDLSLQSLAQVHLVVEPIDPALKALSVSETSLLKLCKRVLVEEHIAILRAPDPSVPTLKLLIIHQEDARAAPDAMAVCVYLTLEQRVLVERLGRKLALPTWSTLDLQIKRPEDVGLSTQTSVHRVMSHFNMMIALATAQSES